MNWNTPLKEVESLRKQVAALTKERDDAIGVKKVAFHHYQETKNQLVTSQAREEILREVLQNADQIIRFEGCHYYLLGIENRDEALEAIKQ